MQNLTALEKLSDKEFYEKCRLFGGEAKKWTRRFAALLPEVARRELYRKYGFYSIFEFAAKLAGMKYETVVEILRVAEKLKDKPLLRAQMEKYGWGKLKVIATIATKENEKMWAEKVETMSKSTLETFVRELRKQNDVSQHFSENIQTMADSAKEHNGIPQHSGENVQSRTGSAENEILSAFKPEQVQGANSSTKLQQQAQEVQNLPPSVPPAQNRIFVRLLLAPKNELKLKELQKKLSREQKALVDLNEVIGILLDAYEKRENSATVKLVKTTELEIKPMLDLQCAPVQSAMPHKPTLISENSKSVITKPVAEPAKPTPPSRHIPTKNKKILYQKYKGRCAWPECVKLPKIFHHTLRFSLNPSHDPNYLVPLCKNHEQLAHHGLIENEELQPENWRLKFEPDKNALKYQIDKKVISHYAPQ